MKRYDNPLFRLNWSMSFNLPLPLWAKLYTIKVPHSDETHHCSIDANDINHVLCEYKNIFCGTIKQSQNSKEFSKPINETVSPRKHKEDVLC